MVGAIVVVLCVVFGVTVLRQKSQYEDYVAATLEAGPMPWEQGPLSVEECVAFTVSWGMECPGVESWCMGQAPRLTGECLAARDREQICAALGDAVASTHFGYGECEQMRETVEGRYAKRGHKKYCAASYRAVAEHCRELGGGPKPSAMPVAPAG